MTEFFSRLSYSFGNEDWHTEHRALKINPKDRVLCVTASGDRPLHLLLDDCSEVIAVDANPTQNFLLELKIAAMQELDFERYIAFLGVLPDKHRVECLQKLLKKMSKNSANYWEKHKKSVQKGVIYQGALERCCMNFTANLLKVLRGKKIARLFAFDNIHEQRAFLAEKWDTWTWHTILKIALNPKISRRFLTDPGLTAHIHPSIKPGTYLYDRINGYLSRDLAKNSILLSLILLGKVMNDALPPYLTENGFKTIKERAHRISCVTGDLVTYIEKSPNDSFDRFSLSDVASYINADTFKRLLKAVHHSSKSQSRFCIREFMSRHQMPHDLSPHFERDTALEQQLEKDDRCFCYSFMTGTIRK